MTSECDPKSLLVHVILFTGGSLSGEGVSVRGRGLYPGEGSLSGGGVSVRGRGLCPGGLCPGGCMLI